ncbi:hypothetical protein B0H14DRAFT_2594171 [Mycena olivaceomarginata]|nr:hypothetical protein B0H14DRAFT_2594171 [Mycena olivaceomarginata]
MVEGLLTSKQRNAAGTQYGIGCWLFVFAGFLMRKQKQGGENNGLQFVNMSGPPQKKQRCIAQPITEASQAQAWRVWEEWQQMEAVAQAEAAAILEHEEEARASIKEAGYSSLDEFLDDLVTTKDQHHSSQVSQMLITHGQELLDSIQSNQPAIVAHWIRRVAGEILAKESAKLVQHLRPPQGQSVSKTLNNFSLKRILADTEFYAPTLCYLLKLLAHGGKSVPEGGRKDKTLVCLP